MKFGRTLNKIAVLSGNAPGFIGNRMLAGYTRQAGEIILQGATPYQVDNAILSACPWPFQMNDLVGLDLAGKHANSTALSQKMYPLRRVGTTEMDRYGQKPAEDITSTEGSRAG